MTSAPTRNWVDLSKTAPKSRSLLACTVMELQSQCLSRRLRAARDPLGKSRNRRVDQKRHAGNQRQQFMQQLQPFRRQLDVQTGHAGHVAARPVEAGDKSDFNRV